MYVLQQMWCLFFSSYSFFCVMLSACCRTVRTCCKSTTIAGITIPVGMRIVVPIHAMHHLPEFWHEPGTFRPERYVGQHLRVLIFMFEMVLPSYTYAYVSACLLLSAACQLWPLYSNGLCQCYCLTCQ